MLVALAVVVLVGVLAVRICMLVNRGVAVAQVRVGQRNEHHDQKDGKDRNAKDPRFRPQRGPFFVLGGGQGDLLEQHFLP
jgi:hypothetical protein